MDWKKESICELREYAAKRQAVDSLPDEIRELKAQQIKTGGSSNAVPVKGGGSSWEDNQLNMIVRIEKMKIALMLAKHLVNGVERGLSALSEEEKLILDRFFICWSKGNPDRLCEELCLEKTAIYKRRDAALRHYTLARYGCIET